MVLLHLIFLAISLCAAGLLATRIVSRDGFAPGESAGHAGYLLALAFSIYGLMVVPGLARAIAPAPVGILSLVIVVMLRGDLPATRLRWLAIGSELGSACRAFPPFLPLALVPLFLALVAPIHGGDSLAYHLPNAWLFLEDGGLGHPVEAQFDPSATTTFYLRGMEAIDAFFHMFPLTRTTLALFKALLLSSLYFSLRHAGGDRLVSAALTAFFISLDMVSQDVGSRMNDLMMALLISHATVLLAGGRGGPRANWTLAACLALALAVKPNALFYAGALGLMWIVRERGAWRGMIAPVLCLLLPFGLCFHVVNILETGSPFPPYRFAVFGLELFPGRPMDLHTTTILSNLDAQTPVFFLRGLIRAIGPAGLLQMGLGLGLLCWRILPFPRRRDWPGIRIAELLFLALWGLGYVITPFSDRNTPVVHVQLYSGHTIRMFLPGLFFFATLVARLLPVMLEGRPRLRRAWIVFMAAMTTANLLWYDVTCMWLKPANAFATLAAATGVFDNTRLAVLMLVLMAATVVLSRVLPRLAAPILIIIAAACYHIAWPESLGRTMRFKQIGGTSAVFSFLDRVCGPRARVNVTSESSSSYFVACLNDFLLRGDRRVRFVERADQAREADYFIICAVDREQRDEFLRGRNYEATFDGFDTPPPGAREIYRDAFYRVYATAQGTW